MDNENPLTNNEILNQLCAEIPRQELNWLPKVTTKKDKSALMRGDVQVAMCLAHLDARHVENRLDEIVGIFGWADDYVPGPMSNSVKCLLTLRANGEEITKSGIGVPSDYDKEKGAESDALKRAAVKFGIGRYLYEFEARWIPFDGYKRIGASPEQIQKLIELITEKNKDETKVCKYFSNKRASYFEELTPTEANKAIVKLEKTTDDNTSE